MNRHTDRPGSTARVRHCVCMQILATVLLAVMLPPSLCSARMQAANDEFPELERMPFSDRLQHGPAIRTETPGSIRRRRFSQPE